MDGSAPPGAPPSWAYGTASLSQPVTPAQASERRYQGPLGYTGCGSSYLVQTHPQYPLLGIQHLPKGRDFNTWGPLGYATDSKAPKDAISATNDPRLSHKY